MAIFYCKTLNKKEGISPLDTSIIYKIFLKSSEQLDKNAEINIVYYQIDVHIEVLILIKVYKFKIRKSFQH